MNEMAAPSSPRNRFLKLSLKKNRLKLHNEKKDESYNSDVIILDESFDQLKSNITQRKRYNNELCSPIVINDSCDITLESELPRITLSSDYCSPTNSCDPSSYGNVSFNGSVMESDHNRPSIGGVWSPAQNIVCATPRQDPIPSTPKDVANESIEECTINKIQRSHIKLLNELYGDVWKTLPNLFKSAPQKLPHNYVNGVSKKLNFDDDESDKENIRANLAETRKLYLTESEAKRKVRIIEQADEGTRAKKKLYTEKIPNTPEPRQMIRKRDVRSTCKKVKGQSVTEMVQNMTDVRTIVNDFKRINVNDDVNKLSFMGSLADNVPTWRCNAEALVYKNNYKSMRDQLTRKLFLDFNRMVFGNGLDNDMPIIWDTKLRRTAGTTTNRLVKTAKGDKIRSSSIKLSVKVLDGPQRLRDTLIHEMCHSATWVIDEELRAAHGPLWKRWATKALCVIPELEEISRCHNMEIFFKYTYRCTKCGYSIHRHSKSIDNTKKCCGYCRGKFELVLNKKNKDGVIVPTPARQGEMNDFAQYVKDNYGTHKSNLKSHAEVMKALGKEYSARKNKVKEVF